MSITLSSKYSGKYNKNTVTSIHYPADSLSNVLYTSSRDGTINVLESFEDKFLIKDSFDENKYFANNVVTDNSNTKLIASLEGNQAIIVDINTKNKICLKGHTAPVKSVAISPDNKKIITGSVDGSVYIWNTQGQKIDELEKQECWINVVKFFPKSNDKIIVAQQDGQVIVYDIENKNQILAFKKGAENTKFSKKECSPAVDIQITQTEDFLAYATMDGTFYVINLTNRSLICEQNVNSRITGISLAQKTTLLAVANLSNVSIYNATSGEKLSEIETEKGNNVSCISFINDDKLAAGFKDGKIEVYEILDGDSN